MKKIALILAFIGTICTLNAQVKEYTITSAIKDLKDSTYSMTIWDGTSQTRSAQGTMRNGQIYYKDTTSIPLVIRITLPTKALYKQVGRGYIPVKSQSIWVVASPGKTIKLTGHLSDFAEVYPSGDKENKVLAELTKAYHPLINAAANISVNLGLNKDKMDAAQIEKLEAEQKKLYQDAQQVMDAFLIKHPSSIAGLYYIEDMLLRSSITIEFAEELLPKITKQYKATRFYTKIENRIAGSKYNVGRPIFNIASSNTYDGKPFTTDSWKGKFYLIDFWGSWCVPCIADVPDLKKLRDAHRDQLEVLGIASDKDAPWRKAVVDHNLDWTQILNGAGDQDFVSRLNVTGFPTKILVAPNGEIVYRSSGGGESSFQKMAEIIKNWKN